MKIPNTYSRQFTATGQAANKIFSTVPRFFLQHYVSYYDAALEVHSSTRNVACIGSSLYTYMCLCVRAPYNQEPLSLDLAIQYRAACTTILLQLFELCRTFEDRRELAAIGTAAAAEQELTRLHLWRLARQCSLPAIAIAIQLQQACIRTYKAHCMLHGLYSSSSRVLYYLVAELYLSPPASSTILRQLFNTAGKTEE